MIIIALDQATKHTGWAVFEGSLPKKYGILRADNVSCRLTYMSNMIFRMIEQVNPDMVVFEDTAYQSNADVYKTLCQLQGTIIGYCTEHDTPYVILKPTVWRKRLGFEQGNLKRAELKAMAIRYVKERFGLEVPEDTAEAICIGCAFWREEEEDEEEREC